MLEPCACLGPIGNDPFCPCMMREKGFTPTEIWTSDKIEEFNSVLKKLLERCDLNEPSIRESTEV